MEFYFPAPLLLQYVPAFTTSELKSLSKQDTVKLYATFNKTNDEDIESHFCLPPNYKALFYHIRNSLRGKYLGKDVKLFFSAHRDKTTPEITLNELEEYAIEEIDTLKELKLRKATIIERILITDAVFRTFYKIYDEIANELKEIQKLRKEIRYLPLRKAFRLNILEKEFFAYSAESGPIKVHYPRELSGFKTICFPLLTWSQLLAFAIQNIVINFPENFDLDPPPEFVADCQTHFETALEMYKQRLRFYISSIQSLITEVDELELYILSQLPRSPIDVFSIFQSAEELGYRNVYQRFVELLKARKVYFDEKSGLYKARA